MNHKQLLNKAYDRLVEMYGGDQTLIDIRFLNRFYQEKKILRECELYTRCLGILGKVRKVAEEKGEHIFVSGTAGSSLIAYLLGATDINPLPRHDYCPNCHSVQFKGEKIPFHKDALKCSCGAELIADGFNIPFESDLRCILSGKIQLNVSHAFFDEVEQVIRDEMGDAELLSGFSHITLVPVQKLDRYRELEKATGYKMRDIGAKAYEDAYFEFVQGHIEGIPAFDNVFTRELWAKLKPQSYDEMLKIVGFAHSTNIWKENGERAYDEHRLSLREIPAFSEELFLLISDHLYRQGIYDTGLAYEVMVKARTGSYAKAGQVDEETALALLRLDMDPEYIFFLENVYYMCPKATGVAYLREAIRMMFYKCHFNQAYNKIILENQTGAACKGCDANAVDGGGHDAACVSGTFSHGE